VWEISGVRVLISTVMVSIGPFMVRDKIVCKSFDQLRF
jgi:hypothetical protein